MALYGLLIGGLALRHWLMGWSGLLDLGIFDEIAWNTAHGRFYWDTIDPVLRHSFLGQHVSVTLIVTGVLYRLVPFGGAGRLIVLQTLCFALSALPLALLGARLFGARAAPVVATIYLLAPSLQYANLFDFHEIALAVPALALACLWLDMRKWGAMSAALLWALLSKEDMSLVVACFGLYLLWAETGRVRWLGAGLLATATAWAGLVLAVIVPTLRGAAYGFGYRYAGGLLGQGSAGLAHLNIAYLTSWWTPEKGVYLLAVLGPWLGFSLLAGWRSLLCLAPLATSLLSTFPGQVDYHNQYAAPFLPLGLACALWAVARWPQPRLASGLLGALVLAAAIAAWLIGPLPGTPSFLPAAYAQEKTIQAIAPILARIPSNASLATINRFGAYLSERAWIRHFPRGLGQATYLLVMAGDSTWDYQARAVAHLQHDPRYHLEMQRGSVLLYHRS